MTTAKPRPSTVQLVPLHGKTNIVEYGKGYFMPLKSGLQADVCIYGSLHFSLSFGFTVLCTHSSFKPFKYEEGYYFHLDAGFKLDC